MESFEEKMDSFDAAERKAGLEQALGALESGEVAAEPVGTEVNLHCHTFFSFNAYGYSPTRFAWRARKAGLAAAGIVDFDVLDGLEEFYAAADRLNLRSCVGIETRVFVPELAEAEINSPGEPGIAYHMGTGMPSTDLDEECRRFLKKLREIVLQRNMGMLERVNRHLVPVTLDYEKDVLPLTPAENATERHLCLAYYRKARSQFPDDKDLAAFWSEKLGVDGDSLALTEGPEMLNLIRAKTMKRGGVGYVQPDQGAFPRMDGMNRFILRAGGIPTITWLNGLSAGEADAEKLIEIGMDCGGLALNIIPDRNFSPGVEDEKLAKLNEIIAVADKNNLPIIVGTEMNSFGLKFVDDFQTQELGAHLPLFLKGAYIACAHAALQRKCGLGYTSTWAEKHFVDRFARNVFYEKMGRMLEPQYLAKLEQCRADITPDDILNIVKKDKAK